MPRVRKFEIVFTNREEFDPVACIRELPRTFFQALINELKGDGEHAKNEA